MPRYAAFLRAINVGGRTAKMTDLKRSFESAGFTKVETVIASGNVVFDAPTRSGRTLPPTIERVLERDLGFFVDTFVRSMPELQEAAEGGPFGAVRLEPADRLFIGFLASAPPPTAARTLERASGPLDRLAVRGREVFWLCRTSFSQSEFSGARIEKTLAQPITIRNATTVRKMAAKYATI